MIRAIVIIRTSTVRQEIEAQKQEICAYARSYGYRDEELVVIGDRGASAIQLDDLYLKNLNLVYDTIKNTPTIEKVFAWSLDRIARDEVVFAKFKNFLIKHRINMVIKNPSLFLLNDDGSVNNGMEMAITIHCIMAKQEMIVKSDRFIRAKNFMSANGKFIGARYMMFGYTTDPNGYLVINEEEAKTVRLIFNLYINNKLSAKDLAKELNERGIKFRNRNFGEGHILNILKNTAYIGYCKRNKLVHDYPSIIEESVYKEAESIRKSKNNRIDKSVKHHLNLALKILKCWDCGANYMYVITGGNTRKHDIKYVCYNRNKKYRLNSKDICTSSCAVQAKVMDEILTNLAVTIKANFVAGLSETHLKELQDRKRILQQKIDNITFELDHIQEKFGKLVDAWTSEIITDDMYRSRVDKLKADQENYNIKLGNYNSEVKNIDETINRSKNPTEEEIYDEAEKAANDIISLKDDKTALKKLIDRFIKVAYPKAIKVNGTNLTILMVADFDNNIYNYVFHQKHGVREGLYDYDLKRNRITNYHKSYTVCGLNGIVEKRITAPKTSTAIENIINSPEAMKDLQKQIKELNKQMMIKIK